MTVFPNGIETQSDAIRLLQIVDGRASGELGEWDIDEFVSCPHPDAAVERCRKRVRDELVVLLASRDDESRSRISPLVGDLIADLEGKLG